MIYLFIPNRLEVVNVTSIGLELIEDLDSSNKSNINTTALSSTIFKVGYSEESIQIVKYLILSKRLEELDKKEYCNFKYKALKYIVLNC